MRGIKSYSELIRIPSFEERFRYLKEDGQVGHETFGSKRYLNQRFYTSREWKQVRNQIIIRDLGADLACPDRIIVGSIYIHHMNPISPDDIDKYYESLLNPEFLVCASFDTHNALHYGDENLLIKDPVIRRPNDTCPWKK